MSPSEQRANELLLVRLEQMLQATPPELLAPRQQPQHALPPPQMAPQQPSQPFTGSASGPPPGMGLSPGMMGMGGGVWHEKGGKGEAYGVWGGGGGQRPLDRRQIAYDRVYLCARSVGMGA